MAKFFGVFLAMVLLVFAAPLQAQTPKPILPRLNFSDGQNKTKYGRLPRQNENDYLVSKPRFLMASNDCKSSGGLLGAMNCITKRIEGGGSSDAKAPASASSSDPKSGITTKSVKNSDGTFTVTRTDKNGKVLSQKIVSKTPASASSTDRKSGITTKSVKNPDGTRTITRTDKNGKVLSEKTVGKTPAFASSTDPKSGITTKSVKNPDGSRTITKTGADGIILSREKVR